MSFICILIFLLHKSALKFLQFCILDFVTLEGDLLRLSSPKSTIWKKVACKIFNRPGAYTVLGKAGSEYKIDKTSSMPLDRICWKQMKWIEKIVDMIK